MSGIFQLATLVVWVLYLQFFLNSYRHRLRPQIHINDGAGHSVDAKCVITNMSAEPIYIQAILATLDTRQADQPPSRFVCSLSDLDVATSDSIDRRIQWFQGPLQQAEMIDIGSFDALAKRALESRGASTSEGSCLDEIDNIEITVVASYTAENRIVAAERSFAVGMVANRLEISPRDFPTRQIRSFWRRRALRQTVARELQRGE